MYLSINIILILLLIICLLNMNCDLMIIKGGNSAKKIELYRTLKIDIDNLKKKIDEIDSEVHLNLQNLERQKQLPFYESHIRIYELQLIIKNLINEKENTINVLEEAFKKYNKFLSGGKKEMDPLDKIKDIEESKLYKLNKSINEPVLDTKLLSDSKAINKKVTFEMTDHISGVKEQESDVVTHITPNNIDEPILIGDNSDSSIKNNNILDTTSSDEDIEKETNLFDNSDNDSEYENSITEEDMDDEYTNSITKDMALDSFSDFTERLLSNNSNLIK